jgi:SNF2 family DNA or RNA helicase
VTGATPVADDLESLDATQLGTREALINRFHDPRDRSILIANPQAVGESISLHKVCRTAIYFDRDFNAGRFIQSKDRIHRYSPEPIGDVEYFFFVSPRTIDDVIDARLAQKEQRLANLIDTDEIPLFTLGDEDSEEGADVRAVLEEYERRKAL